MSHDPQPTDRKYAATHEWFKVVDDSILIGITDHAQCELGDIVFVELPDVGKKLEAGQSAAVIEAVKTVADVYTPVAGEVIAVNTALGEDAGSVNRTPWDSWILKLRIEGTLPSDLLDAEGYQAHIG
ncbi:MAG: hypothetical protein RL318_1025 [Fibrobacterota bacterium]|jgi:glycine cleavage system H protein